MISGGSLKIFWNSPIAVTLFLMAAAFVVLPRVLSKKVKLA
jgi:TctA family transporter